MQRATLTPEAQVAVFQQTFDFDAKPKVKRAVLDVPQDLAEQYKPLVDQPPQLDPRFKDHLTSWFFSKTDGPPIRPGVFWTFYDTKEGRIYGWQLWSGIAWYGMEQSRERARFADAVDVAPVAYQGLKESWELSHHVQGFREQGS